MLGSRWEIEGSNLPNKLACALYFHSLTMPFHCMKLTVSKMDAARSQLLEAINLLFEERDPVSIHTLACAALQILHDHFDDPGKVWDHNLIFHYNTIYIKDEYRKEYAKKVREEMNFFKHADRDLKSGKTSLEFDTELTPFYIFEAIRCLRILEGEAYVFHPEFKVFTGWYFAKYPKHLKEEGKKFLNMETLYDPEDYKAYRDAIKLMKINPSTIPARMKQPT